MREEMRVRHKSVVDEPLVDRNKVILPLLHFKLGLIKQFVKALNKEDSCSIYIIM